MSNNAPDIPIQVEFDKLFTSPTGETYLDFPEEIKYKEILDEKSILVNLNSLEKKVTEVLEDNKKLKPKIENAEKSFFKHIEPQFSNNTQPGIFRNFIPSGSSNAKNKVNNKEDGLITLCQIYNSLNVPKINPYTEADPNDPKNETTNALESIFMYPDIDCNSASLGTPQNLANLFHKHYQKGLMERNELDKKQFLLDLVDNCYLKTYFEKDSKTKNKLEQNISYNKINNKFDKEFLKIDEEKWTNAGTGTHEFNVVGQDSFGDFVELNKVYDVKMSITPPAPNPSTGGTPFVGTFQATATNELEFNKKNGIFKLSTGTKYYYKDNDEKIKYLFLGNDIKVKGSSREDNLYKEQLIYNIKNQLNDNYYTKYKVLFNTTLKLGIAGVKAGGNLKKKITGGSKPDFSKIEFGDINTIVHNETFDNLSIGHVSTNFINTKYAAGGDNEFYVEFKRRLYNNLENLNKISEKPNNSNVKQTLMNNVPLFFDKVNTKLGEGDKTFNKDELFKVLDYHTQINNTLVIYKHFFNNLQIAVEIIIDILKSKNNTNNFTNNSTNKKVISSFFDIFEKKLTKTKENMKTIVDLLDKNTYASIQKTYKQEEVCKDQNLLVKHFLGCSNLDLKFDTIKTLNNILLSNKMSEGDFLNVLKSIDDLDTVRNRLSNSNNKNNQHVFAGLPYVYPVPKISKAIWIIYYFYLTYRKNSINAFGEKLLKIEQNMASRIKTTEYKKLEDEVKSKNLKVLVNNLSPGLWEQKLDALVQEEIKESVKTLKEIARLHAVPQKRKNMNRFKEYYEILRLVKLYDLKIYFYITYLYKIKEYLVSRKRYIDSLEIIFKKYINTFKYFVDLVSKSKEKLEVPSVMKEMSGLLGLKIDALYYKIQNNLVYVGNFQHSDYWNEKMLIFNKYSTVAVKKNIMMGGFWFKKDRFEIGVKYGLLTSKLLTKMSKLATKLGLKSREYTVLLNGTNLNNKNNIYKQFYSDMFSPNLETILKPFILAENNKSFFLIDAFAVCSRDNLSKYDIPHFIEIDGKIVYNNFNPIFEIYNPKTKNKTNSDLFKLLSGSKNFYTITPEIENHQYFTDSTQSVKKIQGVIIGDLSKKSTLDSLQQRLVPYYEITVEELQNPIKMRKWVYDILMTQRVLPNKKYLVLHSNSVAKHIAPYLINKDIFNKVKSVIKQKLNATNKNLEKPGVLTQRTLTHAFVRKELLEHLKTAKSNSIQLNYQTISIVDKKFLSRYDFQKIMMGNLNVEDILHEILISPKKVFNI